jgi:hypothetical protein
VQIVSPGRFWNKLLEHHLQLGRTDSQALSRIREWRLPSTKFVGLFGHREKNISPHNLFWSLRSPALFSRLRSHGTECSCNSRLLCELFGSIKRCFDFFSEGTISHDSWIGYRWKEVVHCGPLESVDSIRISGGYSDGDANLGLC